MFFPTIFSTQDNKKNYYRRATYGSVVSTRLPTLQQPLENKVTSSRELCSKGDFLQTRVVSHLFTGSLAGIGKLPALAGWYIRYGIHGIFCTVRFGGSSILWNFAGTPLKRGAWSIKKGAEVSKKGVPAKCTIPKVLTEISFGIG